MAIGHNDTPFISVYPVDAATGFGTKLANPGEPFPATRRAG